jgi:hypothetical protein
MSKVAVTGEKNFEEKLLQNQQARILTVNRPGKFHASAILSNFVRCLPARWIMEWE